MRLASFRSGRNGGAPLTLIHGWSCDHRAMAPVAGAFQNYDCLSVDLLGHGRSPQAGDYSIEAQARAVLAEMPDPAILIGHSMGAQIAVEAARQAPGKVQAIVLLDPAQIAPAEAALPFREIMRKRLAGADIGEQVRRFAHASILRAADEEGLAILSDVMARTDPEVLRTAWDAIWEWDGRAALAAVQCPTLVIVVEKTTNVLRELSKLNDKVMTGQVAGAGHMLQFEVMPQVEAMIDRFLDLNGLDSGGKSR